MIRLLVDNGADLDSRNLDWTTPQDLFLKKEPLLDADRQFAKDTFYRLKKSVAARERLGNVPRRPAGCLEGTRKICAEFPVYFRYQWPGVEPNLDGSATMSWVRTDMKVSHILYPQDGEDKGGLEPVNGGEGFLSQCEDNFKEMVWKCWMEEHSAKMGKREGETLAEAGRLETQELEAPVKDKDTVDPKSRLQSDIAKNAWRWINFPSNNVSQVLI